MEKDIVVIGGGPAGYIAAIKAGRLGAQVLLAESGAVGGTCLNRGCIPTKYYAHSAHTILELAQGNDRGIIIKDPSVTVDMDLARKGKQKTVKKLTGGVRSLLSAAQVEVVQQKATITGNHEVTLSDGKVVRAKVIIIATGSSSVAVPIPGIDSPLTVTSEEILDLETVPKRLAIIGGGVIGIEFASIFQAFGSEVTVIEAQPEILPMFDTAAVATIKKALKKRGVQVFSGSSVTRMDTKSSEAILTLSDGNHITADLVLLSVGRKANISCVGDQISLAVDHGNIVTDEMGMTSIAGIYAAGDVTGRRLLAHAAYQMGETVAHNACIDVKVLDAERQKFNLDIVPSVVYAVPEIASVGLSEAEAATLYDTVVGKFPLAANGRALASGEPEGFIQVVAERRYGQILGVCCVGMYASEIINEAALAMKHELTVYEVAETIHGHPSVSEAFKEAAAACIGQSYHMV
jgi:dihydrolipoamide dehydrogenase